MKATDCTHVSQHDDRFLIACANCIAQEVAQAEARGREAAVGEYLSSADHFAEVTQLATEAKSEGRAAGIEAAAKLMAGPGETYDAILAAPQRFCRLVDHAQGMCECAERAEAIRALAPDSTPEAK